MDFFHFEGYGDWEIYANASEPEEALDQFLTHLKDTEEMKARIRTDTVLDFFQHDFDPDMESAVNQILHQVHALIQVDKPENNDPDHPIRYARVEYYPQVQTGIFKFQGSTTSVEPYINEFKEILEEKGLQTELYKTSKHD